MSDEVSWMDGEQVVQAEPAVGSAGAALGSDPFEMLEREPDPFLETLERMGGGVPLAITAPELAESDPATPVERPTPLVRRRWTATPTLDEVEIPDPSGLIDRFLSENDRRRLAALSHLVDNEGLYDRFGLSPDVLRRAFPVFYTLYRLYFRVRSEGHENIPAEGPAIFAANHAGILPFDGAMICLDTLLNTDPPRLTRAIVDRWAGTLPWVGVFYARMGQVIGTRENFEDLLADGQIPLVFPEGMDGVRKPITQRYRLQRFHVGFVEQALRARAPIVPIAVIGSENQAPILYDIKPLAKALGLPMAPITPTFPLFGPLGALPYPVGYRIVYGKPLDFSDRFGPEAADDSRVVEYLTKQVRRSVQHLVDIHR